MERHGSESYFVVGEGLLGEALGGRDAGSVAAVAAAAAGPTPPPPPPFRFSRLGPKGTGKQLGQPNRQKIAVRMTSDNLSNGTIPSGFTYLGQFLDHDLTFDKSGLMEGADVSPADLLQSRSPSLDLDSLYGAGPADPGSAQFYSDGLHLRMGAAIGGPATDGFDLPREDTTGTAGQAIIPDPRNDENLAVAQTHLAMIRFHNRVVDTLPSSVPPAQRFKQARKIVSMHYQWMIRSDYLPRICTPAVVNSVFNQGRKVFEVGAPPTSVPTMPLEFSVAAFRFGHSMVRAEYSWNHHFPNASIDQLFEFSHLSGGMPSGLPSIWIADFRRLFNFGQTPHPLPGLSVPPNQFNRATRIDTKLVKTLAHLPGVPEPPPRNNLAFRNLTRANMVKLATGQQMVTFLKSKGVNVTKLTKAQIRDGNGGATLTGLTAAQRTALVTNTPLWFYILREAEFNGGKLGGVGARIVAETFHRAMQGSKFSIVRDPAFRPTLPSPNSNTFRMIDLLFFAFEGNPDLLNPNGP